MIGFVQRKKDRWFLLGIRMAAAGCGVIIKMDGRRDGNGFFKGFTYKSDIRNSLRNG